MNFHPLSQSQIDATVAKVLPQLPAGHTGGLAIDVDETGATFAAELVKHGDNYTLDATTVLKLDYAGNMEAGAHLALTWE